MSRSPSSWRGLAATQVPPPCRHWKLLWDPALSPDAGESQESGLLAQIFDQGDIRGGGKSFSFSAHRGTILRVSLVHRVALCH